ncbi:UNVERIFIED_CONTAM: hypothetical protein K2H54_002635 [Gekko kuhli]
MAKLLRGPSLMFPTECIKEAFQPPPKPLRPNYLEEKTARNFPFMLFCLLEAEKLRLVDGGSRCSGRVEFEEDGVWGTVCDDNWDLVDASVVCRQLDCGWAIQALNGSFFQKGTGPIHLDEVKCSGNESYLWDCSSEKTHDCGHKEDAGVVCSDHQEWRLSGGLDACAGRVEVYYKGVWNTACDGSWYQQQANLLCRSLKCSNEALEPKVPFDHTLLGKMYYDCSGNENSLAQCLWRYNNSNLCDQSRAAGVICNGSQGLQTSTYPDTGTPGSPLATTRLAVHENWEDKIPSYQMLLILCIVLGLLLFLAMLTLIVLLNKRRKHDTLARAISSASLSVPVLMNHSMQVSGMTTGVGNDYREMPTSVPKAEAAAVTIISHTEELDSDYEHYDFKDKPPVALSTFYNSLRHRAADTDISLCNIPMPAMQEESESMYPAPVSYAQEQATAEGSSSTSSGDEEWYENIHKSEQQDSLPRHEPSLGGLTNLSRPLVNCRAGTDSSDSSSYDDMWASDE